jgi:hypothetical protein
MKQFCRRSNRGATFSTESVDFCLWRPAENGSSQSAGACEVLLTDALTKILRREITQRKAMRIMGLPWHHNAIFCSLRLKYNLEVKKR